MKKITISLLAFMFMCTCSIVNLYAEFSGGTGTEVSPFQIKTAEDLNSVRNYVGSSHADKHFRVVANIDLTSFLQNTNEGWLPIGNYTDRFYGHLHGGGNTISGLWINNPSLSHVGFFGVNSGAIDSLTVTVSTKNITGGDYTGGFVGTNSGIITNCGVRSDHSVTITGNLYVGGLAGFNTSTITHCHALTPISLSPLSPDAYSGGLIGANTGTVGYCYATCDSYFSDIHLAHYSGGLLGHNSGTVSCCYANGKSSASVASGGFVGYNNGVITNCYSTGRSEAPLGAGGFVGNTMGGKILNCYSVGEVSLTQGSGAFAGHCGATQLVSQCYYDFNINEPMIGVGTTIGDNIVFGETTVNMKKEKTFVNWDFYEIWGIRENETYPYFYDVLPTDISNIIKGKGKACANSIEIYEVYVADADEKANYSWKVENGEIIAGAGTGIVSVRWNDTTEDGKISVSDEKGKIIDERKVKLIFSPKPSIEGNVNPFPGDIISYKTESNMLNYVWTVTGGEIVSELTNTREILVKWNCSAKTGLITVNYSNEGGCMANKATESPVKIKQPTIDGKLQPYIGETVTYTTDPGMLVYIWKIEGGKIISGQGTQEITVLWNTLVGIGKLSIEYLNKNDCWAFSEITVSPEQLFDGGDGTPDDPFLVCGPKQLDNVRFFPHAHFRLKCNIDLTDFLEDSIGGWRPIPNFTGTFSGACHKISGLWIDRINDDYLGLFGNNSGSIDSLFLYIDNPDLTKRIRGNNYVGALVGYNTGKIFRCGVLTGIIFAKNYVGGLTGYNNNGYIRQTYSTNTEVKGISYVGGLVGYNYGNEARIWECYAQNTTAGSSRVGGLIGEANNNAECNHAYAAGYVPVPEVNSAAGFMGYNNRGVIFDCFYDREVSDQKHGLSNYDNSQYANIYPRSTSDMKLQKTFTDYGWDFVNVWRIEETKTYPHFLWQYNIGKDVNIVNVHFPEVNIYPNPTDGIITVDCKVGSLINVYTLSGQLIRQFLAKSDKETINLSSHSRGIYLLKVDDVMHRVVKK